MSASQPPVQVNISSLTLIKVTLVGLSLFLFWMIRDIIVLVFVAWVFAAALDIWVTKMERWHIPRGLGILLIYLVFTVILGLILTFLVPIISNELSSILNNFPVYYEPIRQAVLSAEHTGEKIGLITTLQQAITSGLQYLTNITSSVYGVVISIFNGFLALGGVLVLGFYIIVEKDGMKKFVQLLAPVRYQPYILQKLNQIQLKLGDWLWGQLILMVLMGVLTGVALWILNVKYALLLAIIAGLAEFVPIIGPVIAAVPAIFFAFTDFAVAPYKPFLVLILFVIIQQAEANILAPKIMNRAIGLNALTIIITLLIGAQLGGLVGALLSVPIATILSIFLKDFLTEKQAEQNRLES